MGDILRAPSGSRGIRWKLGCERAYVAWQRCCGLLRGAARSHWASQAGRPEPRL